MIIYMARNRINDMKYVGATKSLLSQRKSRHKHDAGHRKTTCRFHRALLKYGMDGFEWTIIEEVDNEEELERLETYYIGYYDTYNNGYNETLSGKGSVGWRPSEKTLLNMSKAQSGENNAMYGKYRGGKKAPNYGKKFSKKIRKRMSEARIGKYKGKDNPNAKAVIVGDKYFDTLTEAAKFVGITASIVGYRILHKTKWLDYSYG